MIQPHTPMNNPFTLGRGLYTWSDVAKVEDFTNQVVVLHASALKERYRNPENQLIIATGGFGCLSGASGSAVYGISLSDGSKARWERHHVMGVPKVVTPAIEVQLLKIQNLKDDETLPKIKNPLPDYTTINARKQNNEYLSPLEQYMWLYYEENNDAVAALTKFLNAMRMSYAFTGDSGSITNPAGHIRAMQNVLEEAADLIGIDSDLLILLSSVGFEYGVIEAKNKPEEYGLKKKSRKS